MSDGRLTGSMRVLSGLLQVRTGQFLSENRMWRLETTLKPLMRAHNLSDLEELVAKLLAEGGGELADDVVNALLNNESSFFRDLHVFQAISRDLLPALMQRRPENRTLRVWSAGCSTGQEAYSLAMMFRNEWDRWKDWQISILATDISSAVVSRAKAGLYSQIDVQRGLAITDLLRWFEPVGEEWRVSDELRSMVTFQVDNLFDCTAPSGEYDLILCRNVLLYFSPQMRQMVFDRLARHAAPGAFLLLGAGETVIGQTGVFVPSSTRRGTYERIDPRNVDTTTPEELNLRAAGGL